MSNINPKSPYDRPSSETGYETAGRRTGLRDRSSGPSMLVLLLAVAAILVIGFLVFGRWNSSSNVAGSGTGTDTSTTTGSTSSTTPSTGSDTTTAAPAVPPANNSTTSPATPSTPTPATPPSGSTNP